MSFGRLGYIRRLCHLLCLLTSTLFIFLFMTKQLCADVYQYQLLVAFSNICLTRNNPGYGIRFPFQENPGQSLAQNLLCIIVSPGEMYRML